MKQYLHIVSRQCRGMTDFSILIEPINHQVCTGHGKPGKSWTLTIISFSRPGKSWNLIVGP